MKKVYVLIVFLVVTTIFLGCTQKSDNIDLNVQTLDEQNINDENDIKDHEQQYDEKIWDSEPDLIVFGSEYEFVEAIKAAKKTNEPDIADLAKIDFYFVPTKIPESYVLYKILAGKADIAFFYLPEDRLNSMDSILEAESLRQHFRLVYTRWDMDDPMGGIMRQMNVNESELKRGAFIFDEKDSSVYWTQERELLWVELPSLENKIDYETNTALDFASVQKVMIE